MKPAKTLVCLFFLFPAQFAWSAPLDKNSKTPDWSRATQDEKNDWLAAFKFKQGDVNRAEVAKCLDERSRERVFEANDLSRVTQMCGTIAALPD